MPSNPFGKVSSQGARASRLTPGRAVVQVGFDLTTGIELQRFMRDYRGRFLGGLPSAIHAAHRDVGQTVANEMYQVLQAKMKAKTPQRGRGRSEHQLRNTLRGDRIGRSVFQVKPGGRGVELSARTLSDVVPPQVWRSVNDGWEYGDKNRLMKGHLFRTQGGKLVGPIRAAGAVFSRLGLAGDPRMPNVGANTEFFTSFEGYRFFEEGMRRGSAKLTKLGPEIYLRHLPFPEEMVGALKFFGEGGRLRDAYDQINDPRSLTE